MNTKLTSADLRLIAERLEDGQMFELIARWEISADQRIAKQQLAETGENALVGDDRISPEQMFKDAEYLAMTASNMFSIIGADSFVSDWIEKVAPEYVKAD